MYNPDEDISDKIIRHYICDNPPCVNPSHLLSGTIKDNMDDAIAKMRHAHGETSYAKLTEKQVLAIKQDTRIHRIITEEYGVGRRQIDRIIKGESWSHLH